MLGRMLAIAGPLVVLLVGLPGAAQAVETGHTSWAMHSGKGDYIGAGQDWSYSPPDFTITASGDESHVSVDVSGAENWHADFEADSSRSLQPGTIFEGATRYPFNDATAPGLSVWGDGRGCNTLTGSFTIREAAFDDLGDLQKFSVTFEQHCEGGAPALLGSIAWRADSAAEPLPVWQSTHVSVLTAHQRYAYGDLVEVVAHLRRTATSRTLSIYASPAGTGGAWRLLKTGKVDAEGHLTVTYRVHERTRFSVEYAGDDTTESASDTTLVWVGAKVDSAMRGQYRTSGRDHLFHVRGRPKLIGHVSPGHAGDCLYFRAQRLVGGSWRGVAVSSCIRLDPTSEAAAVLTGTHRVGERLRMRAEWRGSPANAADNGSWKYVRFTQ